MIQVRPPGASLLDPAAGGVVQRPSKPLSSADTLDVSPSGVAHALDAELHRVGFIQGSRPHISSETANLLRGRLRAAAGVLGLGFGLFFVYRLISGDRDAGAGSFNFYFHLIVTLVLISSFFRLCRRCEISLRVLRGYELAIFGLSVAYFLSYDYKLLTTLAKRGYLPDPLALWIGTMFIYAMFIPNTWRRAAAVIGAICLAPLLLVAFLWMTDPVFAKAASESGGFLAQIIILLSVTFLAATYGTHIINTLRNEAFAARQLGQYRLCRKIGSGGMGEVYLAEHQLMKRPCAIKLIQPGKAADPQALARFEREVRDGKAFALEHHRDF